MRRRVSLKNLTMQCPKCEANIEITGREYHTCLGVRCNFVDESGLHHRHDKYNSTSASFVCINGHKGFKTGKIPCHSCDWHKQFTKLMLLETIKKNREILVERDNCERQTRTITKNRKIADPDIVYWDLSQWYKLFILVGGLLLVKTLLWTK